ncbi:MAG TPA: L-threonylcarbamoyladenylate synthase [Candidatus Tectomicrobia bacterium]|nr:L-threonylcarbamoyladenylate synthase [Candidatus Tectomicrobia bacterium]
MAECITRVVAIDPVAPDCTVIMEAAALIRSGHLVAFPTETVYGLGADGLNPAALARVYAAKGRPADNPLILHVSDPDQLPLVAAIVPEIAQTLMQAFWPGPLTLVLPKTSRTPDLATGGLPTVAVRMPAHPVALALIGASETPLAAPSANRSGRPSPTTAQHVVDDLGGFVPIILDAGPASIGVESTVLDVTCTPPFLLRPGGVTREALEAAIGPLQTTTDRSLHRRSPGTRYRHYSPKARVLVLDDASPETLQQCVAVALSRHQRVGCLLHRLECAEVAARVTVTQVGGEVEDYARTLFSALRHLDALEVDVIIVEGVAEEGLGVAVMDRLRRAASPPES